MSPVRAATRARAAKSIGVISGRSWPVGNGTRYHVWPEGVWIGSSARAWVASHQPWNRLRCGSRSGKVVEGCAGHRPACGQ